MTLLQKIKLSWRFGKGLYIISLLLTLAASALVVCEPAAIPECMLLKLLSVPVLLYLFTAFQKGLSIYFYLNLGISRKEYYAIPLTVEFIFFVICMIVTGFIGYAIG